MLATPRAGVNCFGGGNPRKYITIHQTGNTARGADAYMHAKLQQNGWGASWHYSVDDHEAIQSFKHDIKCWHSSDGTGPGNTQSIAIEICINADGDYVQAVKNGAELTAYLMKKEGIPLKNIRQHHDWDTVHRKNCPAQIRAGKAGITWSRFLSMVQQAYKGVKVTTPSTTSKGKSDEQLANEVLDGKHGTGAQRRRSLGSRYEAVQAIVNRKLGVGGGSAKTTAQLADEVMRGLHGNGEQRKRSLGSRYDEVQSYINRGAGASTRTLYLPASASSWNIYRTGGPYTVGNEIGKLKPSKFGGLSYQILSTPMTDVQIIQTQDYGKAAIYTGKGTGAVIK